MCTHVRMYRCLYTCRACTDIYTLQGTYTHMHMCTTFTGVCTRAGYIHTCAYIQGMYRHLHVCRACADIYTCVGHVHTCAHMHGMYRHLYNCRARTDNYRCVKHLRERTKQTASGASIPPRGVCTHHPLLGRLALGGPGPGVLGESSFTSLGGCANLPADNPNIPAVPE